VEALDPEQQARVLNETRNALWVVDDAIRTIHFERNSPDDPAHAKAAFATLTPLPGLLDRFKLGRVSPIAKPASLVASASR
jgi:hypothetical protein